MVFWTQIGVNYITVELQYWATTKSRARDARERKRMSEYENRRSQTEKKITMVKKKEKIL